jgi:hypothetical protein
MPGDRDGITVAPERTHIMKQWSHEFSQNRTVGNRPLTDTYDETGNVRGLLATFLQQDVTSVPSSEVELCKLFFLESGSRPTAPSLEPRAWVHNHRKSSLNSGGLPDWMNAAQVYEALKHQVHAILGVQT